jgi:hypothetical protein
MRLLNKKKKWRKFRNPKRKLKTSFFLIGIVVLFIFQFLFFVLGFQTKNLPKKKKKKKHSVNPRNSFVFYCYHYLRSLVSPFFFLADWPVRRFTRHESFVFGTNCVCLSILERERERNTNRTWNRIKITPFLFFFSFWGSKWKSCLVVVIVRSAFVSVSTLSQESPAHTNGAQSSRMMSKEKRQGRRIDQVELL